MSAARTEPMRVDVTMLAKEATTSDLDTLLARTRESKRRERLHRQIGALEAKLKKIGPNPAFLDRQRGFRLMSKLRRLERELAQPELPL